MKFERNSDKGVSPVVGVILMVAITVILSAIIATFVLDLGGTVSQNPQAGVTFDQSTISNPDANADSDGDFQVVVQVVSMENADSVTVSDTYSGTSDQTLSSVGASATLKGPSSDVDGDTVAEPTGLVDGDKITVTATLEGKTSVIQTYTVDA